jgi:hypothetical protein
MVTFARRRAGGLGRGRARRRRALGWAGGRGARRRVLPDDPDCIVGVGAHDASLQGGERGLGVLRTRHRERIGSNLRAARTWPQPIRKKPLSVPPYSPAGGSLSSGVDSLPTMQVEGSSAGMALVAAASNVYVPHEFFTIQYWSAVFQPTCRAGTWSGLLQRVGGQSAATRVEA